MKWFTSDWHFGHERSLKFEARKGFSSLAEMEEKIMDGLNGMKPGDDLYFAGDLGWKLKYTELNRVFDLLQKKKVRFHWVLGNHDCVPAGYKHRVIQSISVMKDIKEGAEHLTVCHYPMLAWNKSHYGAILIHGHIHYGDSSYRLWKEEEERFGMPSLKKLNVNIEFHDWKPWSFDEVCDTIGLVNNWDYIKEKDK